MKILQLCNRVPYPPNDGGNIAVLSLTRALASQHAGIKMLTLNTKKHFVDLSSLSQNVTEQYSLEVVPIDTTIKVHKALLNLFTTDSYNVNRFYSIAFENKLVSILNENNYDIVLLESIFMTPYVNAIRKNSKAKIVLRAHNVEHIIWERLAVNEKSFLKKKYLQLLARRLKKYELKIINRVDALLPITFDDENVFKKLGTYTPMLVVSVGIDSESTSEDNSSSHLLTFPISLFHLGAMDWMPNVEGVKWFLKECMPLIHAKFPSLKLFLAGRGFPDFIKNNVPEYVICEGEIKDAKNYMSNKQIMIVPLKSGGGMRVKIIQGMALGKTIISTGIGAEGINVTNGKNILIADSPAAFLEQVTKCMINPTFCLAVGNAARELALQHYSNEAIGKKVIDFLKRL